MSNSIEPMKIDLESQPSTASRGSMEEAKQKPPRAPVPPPKQTEVTWNYRRHKHRLSSLGALNLLLGPACWLIAGIYKYWINSEAPDSGSGILYESVVGIAATAGTFFFLNGILSLIIGDECQQWEERINDILRKTKLGLSFACGALSLILLTLSAVTFSLTNQGQPRGCSGSLIVASILELLVAVMEIVLMFDIIISGGYFELKNEQAVKQQKYEISNTQPKTPKSKEKREQVKITAGKDYSVTVFDKRVVVDCP